MKCHNLDRMRPCAHAASTRTKRTSTYGNEPANFQPRSNALSLPRLWDFRCQTNLWSGPWLSTDKNLPARWAKIGIPTASRIGMQPQIMRWRIRSQLTPNVRICDWASRTLRRRFLVRRTSKLPTSPDGCAHRHWLLGDKAHAQCPIPPGGRDARHTWPWHPPGQSTERLIDGVADAFQVMCPRYLPETMRAPRRELRRANAVSSKEQGRGASNGPARARGAGSIQLGPSMEEHGLYRHESS